MEENGSVIGDWMSPVPSPRTFCPGFVAEEFDSKSFSDPSVQNPNEGNLSTHLSAERNSSRGGLTERRAARSGFSAPTINMARIKALNLSSSSTDTQSPYLTIPAGISPTTLLDSPVFLSNSLAGPSPTTGIFSCTQSARTNSALDFPVPEKSEDQLLEEIGPQSSTLHPEWNLSKQMAKPTLESNATSVSNTGIKPSLTIDRHQSLPSFQNMKEFKLQAGFPELSRKISTDSITLCGRPSDPMTDSEHFHPPEDPQEEEIELRGDISSLSIGAPAEDGYNWRKYGQKQVKGSEYPRSYYKCTFPNCEVKKKVERNHAGQITEIIYKGGHNHPKPTLNRRSGVSSSHPFNDFQMNGPEETLEANPSASTAAELCENQDAVEILSTLSNEDDDDGATHESASLGYDAEEDETESKRRKLDACATDMSAGSRAVREPRVVVQTTSEIDVLDDGYRWRKYGQKVVKGNPNPRSYYKCTNPGCTVRKHVERASHDLKSVITTYEGKHNHEVPAAKSGGQASSAPSPASVVVPSASQPLDNFLRRPESAQVHESLTRFDGSASLAAFSLPGRGQIGAAAMANFTLGLGQQGLAEYSSLAALPSVHSYLGHQQGANIGFAVPKGEPKEEPLLETSLPSLNGASAYYHQLMSRMPLGPQL